MIGIGPDTHFMPVGLVGAGHCIGMPQVNLARWRRGEPGLHRTWPLRHSGPYPSAPGPAPAPAQAPSALPRAQVVHRTASTGWEAYLGTTQLVPIADLCLGEPLITDLLEPLPAVSQQQVLRDREYMRGILEYMRKNGSAPRTEPIEVNLLGEVIGGNHRVLAAWMLGWTHIEATIVDMKAGWHVPLDERHRRPLESLLE
mmetsp:Transcript_46659/g.110962  ORF Transcript_46659/g.110962 Transcript_46659/m.110962 type:complete len:200 (-) Transcript_46659:244-843(-)